MFRRRLFPGDGIDEIVPQILTSCRLRLYILRHHLACNSDQQQQHKVSSEISD
jgi:hypothetical protein